MAEGGVTTEPISPMDESFAGSAYALFLAHLQEIGREPHSVLQHQAKEIGEELFNQRGDYRIFDLTSDPTKSHLDLNFRTEVTTTLAKKVTYNGDGEPITACYYENIVPNANDSMLEGTYEDPVVQITFTFTRDACGLVTEIKKEFQWFRRDGTEHPIEKTITVKFDPVNDFRNREEEKQTQRSSYLKKAFIDTINRGNVEVSGMTPEQVLMCLNNLWNEVAPSARIYAETGDPTTLIADIVSQRDSFVQGTDPQWDLRNILVQEVGTPAI